MSKRTAFIMGASQGIGKAIALKLADNGFAVVINSRVLENIEPVKEDILAKHPEASVTVLAGDMSDQQARAGIFEEIESKCGRLDVLINNIPGGTPDTFENCDIEDMTKTFTNKTIAYIDSMKTAASFMKRNEFGRIINIVGNLWKEPGANMFTNSMMNAALINASKNIAIQLAPHNITVNCLNPGFIATDRYHHFVQNVMKQNGISKEEAEERIASGIPMKRVGSAEEAAALAAFLASEEASYITGQQVSADGGSMKSI
ncbi:SDR family oxidoreductase [Bacillus nakamurai]|uniref:Bacilysin biosynthesis protein BacA n=1 Tax=Bacillus nakamurai TaxID=1793963 RepID=A0A150F5N7_9BACI|nr:SDR family oxidoreductase [Bacillus nakamurai]KXZ17007.1 bacilysin biosynthesis protein BacA [Bacillus nakamurai]MCC9022791.1 SDR family oxidoreductase [Bacillus nakamurai]MED1229050.1 SDR family oxidoreductase [Bacillus nakamurai]